MDNIRSSRGNTTCASSSVGQLRPSVLAEPRSRTWSRSRHNAGRRCGSRDNMLTNRATRYTSRHEESDLARSSHQEHDWITSFIYSCPAPALSNSSADTTRAAEKRRMSRHQHALGSVGQRPVQHNRHGPKQTHRAGERSSRSLNHRWLRTSSQPLLACQSTGCQPWREGVSLDQPGLTSGQNPDNHPTATTQRRRGPVAAGLETAVPPARP